MGEDRRAEVHHGGSARSVKTEEIPVGNIYSDASGTLMAAGLGDVSGAAIRKPVYDFTIKGRERKATDACAEYLALLEGMLAKYKDDQP